MNRKWTIASRKWEENQCDFKGQLYYVIFFKSTVYVYCTTFNTVIRTFLGEGDGRLLEGGRLLHIWSLRRGAYLKGALIGSWVLIRAFMVYSFLT